MTPFLFGKNLTKSIREIVSGNHVKCAVAFWGDHRFEFENHNQKRWKIVCDIHMGATSENALRKLGAPQNHNLKFFRNLHTKVYISDLGIVVGSANASSGGVGFDGVPARLLEAGTFHPPGSDVWISASKWFSGIFEMASVVDEDALQAAKVWYRPPHAIDDGALKGLSLLREIAAAPEHYANQNLGFVLCGNSLSAAKRQSAAEEAARSEQGNEIGLHVLSGWSARHVFAGWNPEIRKLKGNFIEIYLGPRGGHSINTHKLIHRFDECGNFYTAPLPAPLRKDGTALPNRLTVDDLRILSAILSESEGNAAIMDAGQLAEAIRRMLIKIS